MNARRAAGRQEYRRCSSMDGFRYSSKGLVYRLGRQEDEGRLRAILSTNDMESWVRMALARDPDYFRGRNLFGEETTIIAEREQFPGEPVGMYSFTRMSGHLNGGPAELGYVSNLRVQMPYRNHIRVLKCGFDSLRRLTAHTEIPFMFTSIASGNSTALRILNANLPGMPVYTRQGGYETLALSARGKCRGAAGHIMERLRERDVGDLVRFYNARSSRYQFSPCLTADWLLSLDGSKGLCLDDFLVMRTGSDISCCMAIWDQRSIRQAVVHGYEFPVNRIRTFYNPYARITGRVELPAPGRRLEQVYLAFLAFGDIPEELKIMAVNQALAASRARGAAVAVTGCADGSPVARLLKKKFRPVTYRSEIETLSWPENSLPDLAPMPCQPEVALL